MFEQKKEQSFPGLQKKEEPKKFEAPKMPKLDLKEIVEKVSEVKQEQRRTVIHVICCCNDRYCGIGPFHPSPDGLIEMDENDRRIER